MASNSKMKFFAAFLLPLLASAAILPDTIGQFHRGATSQPAISDRAVWDEYGLKTSETASYENGADKFTATAYRLQDPTGALAAFDWLRPANSTPSPAAKLAVETKTGLWLVHGNYLLSFDGYKPSKADLDSALGELLNVDNSSLPVLASYLPSDGLVANSERYVTGPASLQKFDAAIPPSVAGFHFGAEAQLGVFHNAKGDLTLAIFNYPTHQMAVQQLPQFEKLPGAMAKRSGPMIAVVLNPPDPDFAEHLLGQVKYQAEVTRDEYVPTLRDNPGYMLTNIFVLTGILVLFAVVSGLVFGAFRSFRRRGIQGREADAIITLDLGN
jgi:hypothetical protein